MTIQPATATRTAWFTIAFAALITTAACLDEMDLGEDEQALYGNTDLFWPGHGSRRIDIDVCWENPQDAPAIMADLKASWREGVRAAVESSWGRYARINFYGWDGPFPVNAPTHCTEGAPGIHIRICHLPTDPLCPALPDSQSLGGYPGVDGVSNGVRLNPNHSTRTWVHEFGHALGWYHEEERPFQASCDEQTYKNLSPISYGDYDPTSVMSYCTPYPNPNDPPYMSPNDIAATQRAYGRRIRGSIVSPRAHCVSAHYAGGLGERAFVWDCDEYGDDQEFRAFRSNNDRFELSMFGRTGKLCLAAAGASNGSAVELATCDDSLQSSWYFRDMYLRGFGGLCMDVQGGSTADGTPIQVWKCGALHGINQKWRLKRGGLIEFQTTGKCAKVVDGRLVLATCQSGDRDQAFYAGDGIIRTVSDYGNCLDVQGPSDAQYITGHGLPQNGARVQVRSCNGSMNQKWNLSGRLRAGVASNLCLHRSGGDAAGNGLAVKYCSLSDDDSQLWDYYF